MAMAVEVPKRNPFQPYAGVLEETREMAAGIRFFRVRLDEAGRAAFSDYKPGQFLFISAYGVGEIPVGIASIPGRGGDCVEVAIARVGTVTAALHDLEVGDQVGIRGPMGNWFPMDEMKGKNVVIVGGGIGMAPLRPVIHTLLDNRASYGRLTILEAARLPSLLAFREEFDEWRASPNTEFHLTVDQPDEIWTDNVGLSTELLKKVNPSAENAVAVTCGPPIMIRFVLIELQKMGFKPEQIITTLETKMKCGIGKCGRCNIGDKYVCQDGPVFSQAEIQRFLEAP